MNYYEQIYDINFFSKEKYLTSLGNSSVIVKESGDPEWETWKGTELKSEKARALYFSLNDRDNHGQIKEIEATDYQLLFLLLCEDAYRKNNEEMFFKLARILKTSKYLEVRVKAEKMICAWNALSLLGVNNKNRVDGMVKEAISFVNDDLINERNVKVELPVRDDFRRFNILLENEESVKSFYQKTYSYILELTAANYQVETLFNYWVIIEFLRKIGIKKIFDYGAGIGTFLFLAEKFGVSGVYADLESKTKDYAEYMFRKNNSKIDILTIDDNFKFPKDIDCIVCTEVLEHIFNPEVLVIEIYSALPIGGIFVVSESFNYIDGFCTHLPQHKGKGGDKFIGFLKGIGFEQISLPLEIHPIVNVKVK